MNLTGTEKMANSILVAMVYGFLVKIKIDPTQNIVEVRNGQV